MFRRHLFPGNQARRGFTLTELAFVLLIASIVFAAIWATAAHVWNNYRIQRTAEDLGKIAQNVREYYMNAAKLSVAAGGDVTAIFDNQSLFPFDMRRNPSVAGGPIDTLSSRIAAGSLDVLSENCPGAGTTATCFRMRFQGLDTQSCIKLLLTVPVNDADLGIVMVGTQNMGSSTNNVTIPVAADTAQGWCNAGANNEVDWDFKLH